MLNEGFKIPVEIMTVTWEQLIQPTYISVPGRYYYREGSKQAITDRLGDTEEAMYLDRARDRWMCDVTIFAVLAGGVTDQIYSRITPRYEWG